MAKKPPLSLSTSIGSSTVRKSQSASYKGSQDTFRSSLNDVLGNLQAFIDHVADITPAVLIEALEPTLGKSLEQVPRDTEALANSAFLEAFTRYKRVEVTIGYARNNSPDYAIYVHEMPYWHEPPTKWKFLQDPLDEDFYTILNSIPRLMREMAGT